MSKAIGIKFNFILCRFIPDGRVAVFRRPWNTYDVLCAKQLTPMQCAEAISHFLEKEQEHAEAAK